MAALPWTWLLLFLCITCLLFQSTVPFLWVGTDAAEDVWSLLQTAITQSFFLEKFTPSVFIDSSDAVNLCVVLAFSPQLPRALCYLTFLC